MSSIHDRTEAAYRDAMRLEAVATALALIVQNVCTTSSREHVAAFGLAAEVENLAGRMAGAISEIDHEMKRAGKQPTARK